MSKTALYPGSFDPVTYGHIDLIKRAKCIFDEVIVGVASNAHKAPLFTIDERVKMLTEATKDIKGIKIVQFDGLVIDYANKNKISDFEYEFQMALTNRRLAEEIETVFLMPSEQHSFVSSTLLKEAAALGADLATFVPKDVEKRLKERLKV